MFKKEMDRSTGVVGDTVIASGVKVEGDFVSQGNVIIEGEVVGSLRTGQDLQVGERAKIHADVSAASATVAGEVRGNVLIREKLELTATSKVTGDIHAKTLIIEAGAQLNGRVLMGAEVPVQAEERDASASGLSALIGGRASKAEKAGV